MDGGARPDVLGRPALFAVTPASPQQARGPATDTLAGRLRPFVLATGGVRPAQVDTPQDGHPTVPAVEVKGRVEKVAAPPSPPFTVDSILSHGPRGPSDAAQDPVAGTMVEAVVGPTEDAAHAAGAAWPSPVSASDELVVTGADPRPPTGGKGRVRPWPTLFLVVEARPDVTFGPGPF